MIRSFQLPLGLDGFALETGGLALSTLPELPDASAGKVEWEAYLKHSNEAMFPILQAQGIPMPSGSAALFDAHSGTLSVRNTVPSMELVESYLDQMRTAAPRSVSLFLEVLETSEEQARSLLKDAQTRADHGPLLARLKAESKDNASLKRLGVLRLEAANGLMMRAEDHALHTEWLPPGPIDSHPEGLSFQARAELRADGSTLELEYELQCGPRAEKGKEWQASRAAGVVSGASISLMDGATKLLGVWRTLEAGDAEGKMRMAFLRARTVMLARDINPLVETKLRELVGAPPQDKPREVVQKRKAPPAGMELRVFSVPRSFLSMGDVGTAMGAPKSKEDKTSPPEAQPADPFAPSLPSSSEGLALLPPDSGNGQLHSAKLFFPEGCAATYMPKDSTLWVVHNPEGLQRIEKFVRSIWRQIPRTLVFSVEVVEADAAVLQEISEVASDTEGHFRAWEMLQKLVQSQQARVVEQHRLETLSERPCQWSSLNARTGAFEIGLQATLATNERTVDMEMTLQQGKGTVINVSSHLRLVAGTPRLVGLWKSAEEGDVKREVLRVVFLRADVVPLEAPVKTEPAAKDGVATPNAK